MLRITSRATEHLVRVRREKGFDANAIPRFIRRAGRLVLTWSRGPETGDRIVDGDRVQTLVAPSAADLLDGKTIDVKATDGRAMLVVRRGEARRGGAVAGTANRANATG
jgi:Fe-S cluster assembly iron-binding protein IscA